MAYSSVTFYIAAHHEDYASFRGQRIDAALADPQTKVVFITVTASAENDPDRWWEASIQQGVNLAAGAALPAQAITTSIAQIKGHPLVVYESGNCVTYCLRLPNGNFDGSGDLATRHESLAKLRTWKPLHAADQPCPLHAVDGSTVYKSWQDFCATLAGILSYERQGICQLHPWINAPDYFPVHTRADHADHKAVAEAVRSFARSETYNRAWWLTLCPANFPTDGLVRRRNRFLPYDGDIEHVTRFSNQADERDTGEAKTLQPFARDEKPYRRLVPWYQFDLDTPPELHACS